MALNLQQIYDKVKLVGAGARLSQQNLERLQEKARLCLSTWTGRSVELQAKVDAARQVDPALRCALPGEAPLEAAFDPRQEAVNAVSLLAVDGSQIAPDRHAAVLFSLLNIGAVVLQPGSGHPPLVFSDSQLLFAEELYTETGLLSEELIAQRRDIAERRKLLELSKKVPAPVVALTDGPVELWGAKGAGEDDYRRNLEVHKSVLSQLQGHGVIVAGYVDKPAADLVVRLLEVASLAAVDMKEIRTCHPLRGVTDRWLYGELLGPGQRSAVFGLQSSSRVHYTGDLALHFFYLNVGNRKHPSLVRVEIPKWVADDNSQLALLHRALLEQCRMLGAKPYPYILHRAHETAVVKFEEKRQIEQMLAIELRRAGAVVDEISGKQSAKDLPGRGRK